jgi:hypothetical protein
MIGNNDIVKIIDNEMSPRFGHTITLGKKILIVKYTNQKLFYLEEQLEQMGAFQ